IYGEINSGRWPVVCLPGLTRNARDFHELALRLSSQTERKVVAFDYRGRGQSAYDPDISHYTVGVEAGDVLAGLAALDIEDAGFIGTSRGGLIIHVLGAIAPAVLKAVVLNDIGPVIEAPGLAHIRSYLDGAPKPRTFT
ncbi:MAG: alpha/beta hydrolase, partial [Mesorhizobium sp.]